MQVSLTVTKGKYDWEQAWPRLHQISEMKEEEFVAEVKKQEDEDAEVEETSDEGSDNEEEGVAEEEEDPTNEGEEADEEDEEYICRERMENPEAVNHSECESKYLLSRNVVNCW